MSSEILPTADNSPTSCIMSETPVLISGAGPTGLFLGLLLRKMNIPCRIIERCLKMSTLSKSIGIQARTQEILQMTDPALFQRFQNEFFSGKSFCIYYGDKLACDIPPFASDETRYRDLTLLRQADTIRILVEAFEKEGGKIDWGWELMDTKVVQEGDENSTSWVETTVRKAIDGTNERSGESKYLGSVVLEGEDEGKEYEYKTVKSQFLIGADGARSSVRHKLRIPFPGKTREHNLIVFDGVVDANVPLDHFSSFNGNLSRNVIMFPLGEKNRVQLGLSKDLLTDEQFAAQKSETLTVEHFQQLLNETLHPIQMTIKKTYWLTYYRINERRAQEFTHKGRIFLAGDAAHIHSPSAGQGLNLGLQDAHNLAWKLAMVLNGTAPHSLLNSYEEERPTIADEVIKFTAKIQKDEFGFDGPFKRMFKRVLLTYFRPLLMPILAQRTAAISMTCLRYHENSLNKSNRNQHSHSGSGSIGQRAGDAVLVPLGHNTKGSSGADALEVMEPTDTDGDRTGQDMTRLHDLMAHPGVFQILVFTGAQWKYAPEALALRDSLDRQLASWKSKWPSVDKKEDGAPRHHFMVHTFTTLSWSEATSNDNGLMDKAVGEGKSYLDVKGVLHRRYGVDPTFKKGVKSGGGAIIVVRPDSYIAYRVQGVGKCAWNDVDEYFQSILV